MTSYAPSERQARGELAYKHAFCAFELGKLCRTVEVAVKTLKPGMMTAADFLNEAKAMHRLRHRKLVLLMGVCTKKEPYYIITELMVNGSLLDYMRKEKHDPPITFNVIVDMAAQV